MSDDQKAPLVDLTHKYGGTEFTGLELLMLGDSLLTWITTVKQMGHASPGSLLDYVPADGVIWHDIVRDFVAWSSGRKAKAPGCDERLRTETEESGWDRYANQRMSEALGGPPLTSLPRAG